MHSQTPYYKYIITLTASALLSFAVARAATDTWTDNNGAGDSNWATPTNWSDAANGAPNAFDSLLFTGTNGLDSVNNFSSPSPFPVSGISFNAAAGSFVISGSDILLSGKINDATSSIGVGISDSSANIETFTAPLTLDWGTYTISSLV